MTETKIRGPRVSLTKKQLASAAGAELLALCQNVTSDGSLNDQEVNQLRVWLHENRKAELPSIEFLAVTVERMIADGKVTKEERRELYQALESVLPTEARQTAKARRAAVESAESTQAKAEKVAAKQQEREERERRRPIESFDFMVAGVHHDGRHQVVTEHVEEADPVFLIRDPGNKYSSDAIKVRLRNGMEIGFVPEDDAQDMAGLLDDDHPYTAIVKKILTGGRAPIPIVLAKFYQKDIQIEGAGEEAPPFKDHPYPKKALEGRKEDDEDPESSTSSGCGCLLIPLLGAVILGLLLSR